MFDWVQRFCALQQRCVHQDFVPKKEHLPTQRKLLINCHDGRRLP